MSEKAAAVPTSAGMPSRLARALPWATLNGPNPLLAGLAASLLAQVWVVTFMHDEYGKILQVILHSVLLLVLLDRLHKEAIRLIPMIFVQHGVLVKLGF